MKPTPADSDRDNVGIPEAANDEEEKEIELDDLVCRLRHHRVGGTESGGECVVAEIGCRNHIDRRATPCPLLLVCGGGVETLQLESVEHLDN